MYWLAALNICYGKLDLSTMIDTAIEMILVGQLHDGLGGIIRSVPQIHSNLLISDIVSLISNLSIESAS